MKKPSLKNKITTTIALTVIFLSLFIIITTKYLIAGILKPEIANRISGIITLSSVISIALSIFIGLWLSGIIIKPILAFNDACRRIVAGDFNARAPVVSHKCWEIMSCNNTACPAYGHFLERCWFIAGTMCKDKEPQGIYAKKIGDCKKCRVFNSYESDEIIEFSDIFNYMARHLKEVIEKLDTAYREIEKEVLLKTEELQIAHNELLVKHKEVKEHEEELIAINKELDSFVYTASHDLKEPLRGIETFSKFLLDDYWDKLDDEGKDYLRRISRGANRLKLFIDDLLTLSRISRIKNPYETFEPIDIINDVLKRLDVVIKERDCKIKVDDSLPLLWADKTKTKEVFYNLISNAIKYSDKKPEIEIGGREEEESAIFFVRDNGIGIKEGDMEKIFEPFKRLHKRDEYITGTGIGLAIVKKIIDEHKGRVWVESKIGEGSTFYFILPKKKDV
jgi:signal transduction histidine kinase